MGFCSTEKQDLKRLVLAAERGKEEEMEALLQWPMDPNSILAGSKMPLHLACKKGHAEVARLLLEAKADKDKANKEGATPLWLGVAGASLFVPFLWGSRGAFINEPTQKRVPLLSGLGFRGLGFRV